MAAVLPRPPIAHTTGNTQLVIPASFAFHTCASERRASLAGGGESLGSMPRAHFLVSISLWCVDRHFTSATAHSGYVSASLIEHDLNSPDTGNSLVCELNGPSAEPRITT